MKEQELEPCPFCGAVIYPCDESPIYGMSYFHPDDVCLFSNHTFWIADFKRLWNRRPQEEALQKRIEELEDAIEELEKP